MLDNNIEYALIGHNYLAFLLSIGLLKRSRKVLLLDDDRFNYGDFFINSLTQLDFEFLSTLGKKNANGPLLELASYTTLEERIFYIGKKQILLGRSPGQNLMELCRKLPHVFHDHQFHFSSEFIEEFDREYFKYCEVVTSKMQRSDRKINLYQIFTESFEGRLKSTFDHFIKALVDKEQYYESMRAELITLVYLTRGFYQSHFATSGTKVELLHGLLSLLSPYYKLDYHRLNTELLTLFKEKGGEFKKLNLGDLKFNKGIISGMELESFEGMITPQKIIFVGGHPLGLPMQFERPKNIFNCLKAEIILTKIPDELVGKKIIFSSPIKISTNRPLFEADFFKDRVELNIVVSKKNGIKIDFIKKQILEELISDFRYLFKTLSFEIQKAEMRFTHDIFIEELHRPLIIKDNFRVKNKLSELFFAAGPLLLNRPKNVFYMGPYNDGFLGTLSSLLEIYRWQEKV